MHGVNHAKQIVIDEAECLAEKLSNGKAGCAETQGRAIGLLVQMVSPMFAAEFVTVEDCRNQHKELEKAKKARIKIGPLEFEGILNPTIGLFCLATTAGFVFVSGKLKGWW